MVAGMMYRILLFVALNAADMAITQAAEFSSAEAGEANPILRQVIMYGGWPFAWAAKLSAALLFASLVCLVFDEIKRRRVMKVLNFAFCGIVVFNLFVWCTTLPAVHKFVGMNPYIRT